MNVKLKCGLACVLLGVILNYFPFPFANAKLAPKKSVSNAENGKMLRKMQRLAEASDAGEGIAELSLKEYRDLVFEVPRNYTVFVLFHNEERICHSCPQILGAFKRIGKAFWRGFTTFDQALSTRSLQAPIFFVSVSMAEGYRQMLVDLDPSRPSLYLFSPSLSSKYNQFEQAEPEIMNLRFGQYKLDVMLGWVQEKVGFYIPMEKLEESSDTPLTLIMFAVCGVFSIFNLYYFGYLELVMEGFANANYCYGICVLILWLISGQMYNYIRNTPFMGAGGFAASTLIYPGSRYQYGIESIIVMLIYALILYSLMHLVETRERQFAEGLSNSQVHFDVVAGLSGFFFGYLLLQIILQMKTAR